MPSRAWVVTGYPPRLDSDYLVSMPSRAWVVTLLTDVVQVQLFRFNALSGLSCYYGFQFEEDISTRFNALSGLSCYVESGKQVVQQSTFQCPLGLELLLFRSLCSPPFNTFQCPLGLELLLDRHCQLPIFSGVSMPSRAWVVTLSWKWYAELTVSFNALSGLSCYLSVQLQLYETVVFQCPLGLELLRQECPIF